MKKYGLTTFIFLFFLHSSFFVGALPDSHELLGTISQDAVTSLFNNEHVFRYDQKQAGLQYCPDTGNRDGLIELDRKLDPEVRVEGLYLLPYPEGFSGNEDEIINTIYKLSHKISSISGVKYFSVRRDAYAVLFSDAYAVNNLKDKKKIKDPFPPMQSDSDRVYLRMKENALGWGYYRIDYKKNSDNLTINLVNESDLGFILPAVAEGNMRIFLEIIPCSDVILVYGYCGVVLQNDNFVNMLLDPYYAFYRRMTAMETWLYNNLHDTDKLPPLYEPMP